MKSFTDFAFNEEYKQRVQRLGDWLAETGKDRAIWAELQRQLDSLGLKVKQGVVQDATFITADPGPCDG